MSSAQSKIPQRQFRTSPGKLMRSFDNYREWTIEFLEHNLEEIMFPITRKTLLSKIASFFKSEDHMVNINFALTCLIYQLRVMKTNLPKINQLLQNILEYLDHANGQPTYENIYVEDITILHPCQMQIVMNKLFEYLSKNYDFIRYPDVRKSIEIVIKLAKLIELKLQEERDRITHEIIEACKQLKENLAKDLTEYRAAQAAQAVETFQVVQPFEKPAQSVEKPAQSVETFQVVQAVQLLTLKEVEQMETLHDSLFEL
jgi:hypothetical protein